MKKLVVLRGFADRDDFAKKYQVGDAVEFQDGNRIADLINRGLCKEVKNNGNGFAKISLFDNEYDRESIFAALKNCDVKAPANISAEKLIEKINQLDEETIARLQKALEEHNL
ncbi:MAG: hypothetical protein FWF52_04275 [Candidatus Azobacteroides sp.]|nr:hypothetical protein [Candidatus Azobacteroides sp.]